MIQYSRVFITEYTVEGVSMLITFASRFAVSCVGVIYRADAVVKSLSAFFFPPFEKGQHGVLIKAEGARSKGLEREQGAPRPTQGLHSADGVV